MYNDILYTVNKRYLPIFLSSLYSLLENGNLDNVRIHLVTEGFDLEDFKKVSLVIDHFPGVKLNTYSLDYMDIDSLNIPNWRGSQIANARLFLSSILDLSTVYNLLYIDADTIIVGPLNELKEKYSRETLCASLDGASKRYGKELYDLDRYYNSGVLFFNVNLWLGIEAEDRIRYAIKNYDGELKFPDQDLLNIALSKYITTLPPEYNMSPYPYVLSDSQLKRFFNEKKYLSYDDIVSSKDNAKILHSVGLFGIKPWTDNNVNPFNDVFMEYLYKIDPFFRVEELPFLKKLFTFSPKLFYSIIAYRSSLPEPIEDLSYKVSMILQQTKKK